MTPTKKAVRAKDIVVSLTEQEPGESMYVLRDARIEGKLDLRHRTVTVAVDIQDCEFLEDVDVRYCEFTQAVNLSHCTFHKDFNTVDDVGANTIYRKNLVCDDAVFEKDASFNGSQIEGSAYFTRATFEGATDFSWMKCNTLTCNGATFGGPTDFNTLKCQGSGLFRLTTFQDVGVSFAFASFDENLEFQGSTIYGTVSFNTMRCGGSGHFTGVQFLSNYGTNFGHASFAVSLYLNSANDRATVFAGPVNFQFLKCSVLSCNGTQFHSSVNFSMLTCVSGLFRGTQFRGQGQIDFSYASVSSNLDCDRSSFQGPTSFNALKCEGSGFFDGVRFLNAGEVNFGHAFFGRDLSCIGATIKGLASFNRLRCEGSAWFDRTRFENKGGLDLSFAQLGSTLRLIDARFAGPVDLSATRTAQSLTLTDQTSTTRFEQEVTFYAATARVLVLEGNTLPFEKGRLNLREFTFERFLGSEQQATQFAEAQDPAKFSRDPYVQLERYYESVGKDIQARDTHFRGRLALRKNATRKGDRVAEWSAGRKVNDWLLKVLTGYGVYTGRIVLAILLFIIVGMGVFSADEVLPVDQALIVTPSEVSAASDKQQSSPEPAWAEGFSYSVDRFVPISVGAENELEPRPWWSEAYALAHAIFGWLLIALFLASWTGLVRRR